MFKYLAPFFLLLPFTSNQALAVVLDGKNWMQVTQSVNFTYNNLAGVCSLTTGACNGSVTNAVGTTLDLTGWTWASHDDMASLFQSVTGAPAGTFDAAQGSYFQSHQSGSWADQFIDTDGAGSDTGFFDFTLQVSASDFVVFGLTRSIVSGSADRSYIRSTAVTDAAIFGNPVGLDIARSHTGMWLFQPTAVPGPGVSFIILLGLFGICASRRQTQP